MEKRIFKIDKDSENLRIDIFLSKNIKDFSRTSLKDLIIEGKVLVNPALGKDTHFITKGGVKPHYLLKFGDEIELELPSKKEPSLTAENIPLDIIYEDEDLIVVNKPFGLVVHPGAGNENGTLVNALLYHTKELSDINPERLGIVHRLDKETSGVMVVAKNNWTHLELTKQFKKHSIKRRYIALVKGRVRFKEGVIDVPIGRHPIIRKKMSISFSPGAKEAVTFYRVIKRFTPLETGRQRRPTVACGNLSLTGFTLLELIPKTGRTHQLRVHLAYLKHPILGDSKYGNKNDFPRLALHAKDLCFFHPRKEKLLEFSSALPDEIKNVIGNAAV